LKTKVKLNINFKVPLVLQADLRINIGLSFFNVSYSTFGHSVSGKRKNSQSTTEYQEKFLFAQDKVFKSAIFHSVTILIQSKSDIRTPNSLFFIMGPST
jgi:hypothetical protein